MGESIVTKKHFKERDPINVNISNSNKLTFQVEVNDFHKGNYYIYNGRTLLSEKKAFKTKTISNIQDYKDETLLLKTNLLHMEKRSSIGEVTINITNENGEMIYPENDDGSNIDSVNLARNEIASIYKRFKFIIPSIIFIIFFNLGYLNSKESNFNEIPNHPSLILFNQDISSIEKPTTPSGLALNTLSLIENENMTLSFSPYWLISHKGLDVDSMLNIEYPLLENLNVGVSRFTIDDNRFTSLGIKTRIFQKYGSSLKKAYNSNLNKIDEIMNGIEKIENEIEIVEDSFIDGEITNEHKDLLIKDLKAKQRIKLDSISSLKDIHYELIDKQSISIDYSFALGGIAMDNSFDKIRISRYATWLVLNVRPYYDNDFYFSILGRYINNTFFMNYADNSKSLDLGGRLNYDVGKCTFSFEYVKRLIDEIDTSEEVDKFTLIYQYKLKNNLFLTASAGKDFSKISSLFAAFGLTFSLTDALVEL